MDLFVRTDNYLAVALYDKLKYSTYRHILEFYGAHYDAFGTYYWMVSLLDMRKALRRDKDRTTIISPYDKPVHVSKISTTL